MLFNNIESECKCLYDFTDMTSLISNTPEHFLFHSDVRALLSYIGYKKNALPKVGDRALSINTNELRTRLLTVTKVNPSNNLNTVFLKNSAGREFIIPFDWWKSILIFEK